MRIGIGRRRIRRRNGNLCIVHQLKYVVDAVTRGQIVQIAGGENPIGVEKFTPTAQTLKGLPQKWIEFEGLLFTLFGPIDSLRPAVNGSQQLETECGRITQFGQHFIRCGILAMSETVSGQHGLGFGQTVGETENQ